MYNKQQWLDEIPDMSRPILDGSGKQKTDPQTGRPLFELVQAGTRITSARLNTMESGIEGAHVLIEQLANELAGNFVAVIDGVMGLQCSTQGLTASWTAGVAYVGGRRFEVSAGNMTLNPTQGQYLYVDADGTVKKTTSQATAKAGVLLFYVATDASGVISSTDQRVNISLEEILMKLENIDVPEATLTEKGIVQLSNATNGTRENVAATEKAVKDAYDRGSAGVTAAAAAQAKADAAETPAGAQAKANAAEANAKNYVDGKAWQKQRLTSDSGSSLNLATGTNLNNIRTTGFYDGSGLINAPGNGWFYFEVQSHSSNPGAWTIQKAHDFNNNTYYQRTCTNGTWSAWQELFQSVANGKQAIATAISGKGVAASGSDEFAVLANKISQISTGRRTYFGTLNKYVNLPNPGDGLTWTYLDIYEIQPSQNYADIFPTGVNTKDTVYARCTSYPYYDMPKWAALAVIDEVGTVDFLLSKYSTSGDSMVGFSGLTIDRKNRTFTLYTMGGSDITSQTYNFSTNINLNGRLRLCGAARWSGSNPSVITQLICDTRPFHAWAT